MIFIAIFLPWLSFFLRGKVLVGIICLILQISLFGWLPAAIWAVYALSQEKNEQRMREVEERLSKKGHA